MCCWCVPVWHGFFFSLKVSEMQVRKSSQKTGKSQSSSQSNPTDLGCKSGQINASASWFTVVVCISSSTGPVSALTWIFCLVADLLCKSKHNMESPTSFWLFAGMEDTKVLPLETVKVNLCRSLQFHLKESHPKIAKNSGWGTHETETERHRSKNYVRWGGLVSPTTDMGAWGT